MPIKRAQQCCYGSAVGDYQMDQFEFVYSPNIKRYQNLLETSVDETERRIIQKLLTEEEAKQRKGAPPSRRSGG